MTIRNIAEVEELLRGTPTVQELYAIWEARRPRGITENSKSPFRVATGAVDWLDDYPLAERFIAATIGREEFMLVLEAAREILGAPAGGAEDGRTQRLHVRMNYARALTRLGFTKEARRELELCMAPGFQLARARKAGILIELGLVMREEWLRGTERGARIQAAKDALHYHRIAFDLDPERLEALAFCASTAFILRHLSGDLQSQARETAQRVLGIAKGLRNSLGVLRRGVEAEATAHAVLEDTDAAFSTFGELSGLEGITTADLAEARFQAQFLAEALGKPRSFFNKAFPRMELIVFSGHLPDRPGEGVRFPVALVPAVQDALRKDLGARQARVGLSCASAGADLLFVEALLARGGHLHLVLPWDAKEFRRTSILPFDAAASPAIWEPLYRNALGSATTTREIGYFYEPGNAEGWQFTMEVTAGIALQTARALRLDVRPMVVWDKSQGRGAGGTYSFYQLWKHTLNNEPDIIPVDHLLSGQSGASSGGGRRAEASLLRLEVKTMLFGDLAGYSKLSEKTIPEFIGTFLARLGELVATSKHSPISVDIWGDAIRAIFDRAHDAGLFALELAELLVNGEKDWIAKGLYSETQHDDGRTERFPLNIRIGLHTGPVAIHFNPVTRKIEFTGAHVIRAARIEPVAPPGQVFASEEFAAMVELTAQKDGAGAVAAAPGPGFVCEFAGTMKLAKDYPGRHRIYRVVRQREFAIEALAKAAHEDYCEKARARRETPETNPALRPWDQLNEDLRDANRAQVSDIPNKLRLIHLELTPWGGMHGSEIAFTAEQLESLAEGEHQRWMEERKAAGWTYAGSRDNARKYHPLLVPWDRLPESEKEKDRDSVRAIPKLIEKAEFHVKPIV